VPPDASGEHAGLLAGGGAPRIGRILERAPGTLGCVVFVEGLRLIIVLAGVFGGYEIGSELSSGPAGIARAVGAVLGALVAYVIGGMLGRFFDREVASASRSLREIPATELLAGIVVGGVFFLIGIVLTVPLLVLAYNPLDFTVTAAVAWLLGALGLRLGMSKGHQLSQAVGLTRRLQVASKALPTDGLLLDSSAVMDRSLLVLGEAGLLPRDLLVPEPVFDEVTTLANGPDPITSRRARRGLEALEALQTAAFRVTVVASDLPAVAEVSNKVIAIAKRSGVRVATCSAEVVEALEAGDGAVVDLRRLVSELLPDHVPGEQLSVDLLRPGRQERQAVGYLADGEMVVVNDAAERIGEHGVEVIVLSTRQTSQGLLIFARLGEQDSGVALAHLGS